MGTEQITLKKDDKQTIKCVVWDLDNTLWRGTLLEDNYVVLRSNMVNIIKTLDQRGVLQSIASKNDELQAMAQLKAFGLQDYFLYPQINWNSKASSLKIIAQSINIGLDTLAFIDDQPFEREEVSFSLPEILCLDAADLDQLLNMAALNPRFITSDSSQRRQMYLSDIVRNKVEEKFIGPKDTFLATLDMAFTISEAQEDDLQRAEELTVRTNQLNTTGYTYSYDELNHFRQSAEHKLLIAGLNDKYGSYGKIGLVLIECRKNVWTLKILLMSCRVMSRGVGTILLNHIMMLAKNQGVRLQAEFVSNNRNRMMLITYKFAGFKEVETQDDLMIFENDLSMIQPYPAYVNVEILDAEGGNV